MTSPSYPPGVHDSNLEDDQHCALSNREEREAEERDMKHEEKTRESELWTYECE